MTVSWWDVFLTISGLSLAVWVASKVEVQECQDCKHDCEQGKNCPKKDKQ